MIDPTPHDFIDRITEHYQNMKITNKRIMAQFRSQLRRVNYSSAITDKDKYQSTCMETINERSKEAEADSFQLFQPRPAQDSELHEILNQPVEKYYQTNQQTAEMETLQNRLRSFQNKLMKSAGWTVDPTRESLTKVEKNTPQPYVREFCHIYDQN